MFIKHCRSYKEQNKHGPQPPGSNRWKRGINIKQRSTEKCVTININRWCEKKTKTGLLVWIKGKPAMVWSVSEGLSLLAEVLLKFDDVK